MPHQFLSDDWFAEVDELIADAGDLNLPPEMKDVELNVTVVAPDKETHLFMKDGLFVRGHRPGVPTTITLPAALARKIFVDVDTVAGVQGFLAGELKVDGDLAKVVAMQTAEPSVQQKLLASRIAAITA